MRTGELAFERLAFAGRVEQVLQRTFAGGVTVNDCMFHVGQCTLPFGGLGPSGMGRYHGFGGFETFSHKKGRIPAAPPPAACSSL